MNNLISVIIPVHNNEKTLEKCVNSVLTGTYQNFEILLIENGSDDNSRALSESLSQRDSRISVFESEKGVSRARNVGIEKAYGDFITFLDADDTLTKDALETFANGMNQVKSDIYCAFSGDGKNGFKLYSSQELQALISDFLKNPTQRLTVWSKLYSSEFLKQSKVLFDVRLSHGEDSDFVINLLLKAKSVAVIDKTIYNYTVNEDSAVHKIDSSVLDKYVLSMSITKEKLINQKAFTDDFYLYALNNLLVFLTHQSFSLNGYKNQKKSAKDALSSPIFKEALLKAKLKKLPIEKAVTLFFAKHNLILLLSLPIKLRKALKKIKASR